jgi:leucyl aminopeptidase
VLVGKGITFDSGGISIKSAASMGEMKFDMMGAATALAVVRAARRLALPVTVTALTPIAENVPSGTSYRPGDILRMRNGKTVEVDNTDAEGRLILADALSYAEKFRPDAIVDFATLTGAVVVALGHECAGVMGNDDRLVGDLLAAGERTGDRFWRLPLWDEYRELLKSDYADMKNAGGRWAGSVSAAIFLKEFVPAGIPWAHCDIAGTAHFEKARAGYPAGASGFGIAAMVDLLRRRSAGSAARRAATPSRRPKKRARRA